MSHNPTQQQLDGIAQHNKIREERCKKILMKKPMDELLELVAKMREAQMKYFKERTPSTLAHSKDIERLVDKKIIEIKTKQINLFS